MAGGGDSRYLCRRHQGVFPAPETPPTSMSATLPFPSAAPAISADSVENLADLSTHALVRQIAAAAERKAERNSAPPAERRAENSYRRPARGRVLRAWELAVGATFLGGFVWAVWLQARPVPMEPIVAHYRSLVLSAGDGAVPGQGFVESSLLEIGREWNSAAFFARVHPRFWGDPREVDPNQLAHRVGDGLARLSEHGRIVSASVQEVPLLVTEALRTGGTVLVGQVQGQVEFQDGTVLPFTAGLIRDEAAQKWGLTALTLPPALP